MRAMLLAGLTYAALANLILGEMNVSEQQKQAVVLVREHGHLKAYHIVGITVAGSQPYIVTRKMK